MLLISISSMSKLLKFSVGNAKLSKRIVIFSLPAGHYCHFAKDCKVSADRDTGDLNYSSDINYMCFAARQESRLTNVRDARWHNLNLLMNCKSSKEMADLIYDSLRYQDLEWMPYVRIHESGDFFSRDYFHAWDIVAYRLRKTIFYAYTKALPFWLCDSDELAHNFMLTASWGGTHDHLILEYPEVFKRHARVVYCPEEAHSLGLEIDHDDSHCWGDRPFALLLHGTQAPQSAASRAVTQLRKRGIPGYYTKQSV